VWFAYVPGEWVLKGVSFHISPKQTVAFVGSTGSGKTTILSLICRNYDIQKGQILIDGTSRSAMVSVAVMQKILSNREHISNRQRGIEMAKKKGKYKGRKPVEVDENVLKQVAKELDEGIINVDEAMKRTKINSRSTFYRKLKKINN
jgi:ABC-type transport system involved in Fe-S cluster assembly fused permease/ATPase subunit